MGEQHPQWQDMNCPKRFCMSVGLCFLTQGTAISKKAIFLLNAPSQERMPRRAESAHSGCSHGATTAALGTEPVSATQGKKSGLRSNGITMTSLVNKPVEFSLLSHLLSDKTTLIALVINCCNYPSYAERVSHCCWTWLQAIWTFRGKALVSPRRSGLRKKTSFPVSVVKGWRSHTSGRRTKSEIPSSFNVDLQLRNLLGFMVL